MTAPAKPWPPRCYALQHSAMFVAELLAGRRPRHPWVVADFLVKLRDCPDGARLAELGEAVKAAVESGVLCPLGREMLAEEFRQAKQRLHQESAA